MGYVPRELTTPGTELEIDIRGTRQPAKGEIGRAHV